MEGTEPTGSPPRERRRHPRYALDVAGTAWILSGPVANPFSIRTSNISLGGMMLHTAAGVASELAIGDLLLLNLNARTQTGREANTHCKARVTWKRRGLANLLGSWAFGVCFLDTPEEAIQLLLAPAAGSGEPLPET